MSVKDFDGTNVVNNLDMGDFYPSDYLNVRIVIETAYEYEPGWGKDVRQKYIFENEVYGALKENGFKLVESTIFGASPTLKSKNVKTSLYLHPMEFSGFAKQEEIDKIVEILKNCKSVKNVIDIVTIPSYDIDEKQHARILAMNIKFIENFIRKNTKKNAIRRHSYEFCKRICHYDNRKELCFW